MSKEIWDKPRPKGLGKPHHLSPKQKASAKASAKAAGRPYPNLVDNMRAAREDGGPVQYDTGPKPGEATLRPYNPTLPERFKNYLMGTNTAKPSPERRHFVEGLTEAVGMAPGVSNVLAGERLANAVAADDLLGAGAAAVGMIPGVGKYVGNKALQQIQKRMFADGGNVIADALRLAHRRVGYDDGGSVGNPVPADGAAPPSSDGWNWQNNYDQFGFNLPRQGGSPQPDQPTMPQYDGGHYVNPAQPQPGTPSSGFGGLIGNDYQNYHGMQPDQGADNYWQAQLNSGAMTPSQVQSGIQNSSDFKNPQSSNPQFITNEYQQDLGRSPDQNGMQYWLSQLNSGAMNQQQVADAMRLAQRRGNGLKNGSGIFG